MKPITLVMSAFGSYGGVETIDFQKTDTGLFLITGDTGAGKSTIFDAIMFALYDTMSGKERKGNMMRSEYAKEDAETFVEYTFAYGRNGEQYTVKRYPTYERRAKRKNKEGKYGITKQAGKVQLILPNGEEYLGKAAQINEKIQEIIGLTAEQFQKIAMIAQGEFQELIMDKTGNRKAIFQQLFSTEIYEKIEKRIGEKYKESLKKAGQNRSVLQEAVKAVVLEKEETESTEWKQAVDFMGTEPERMVVFLQDIVAKNRKKRQEWEKTVEKTREDMAVLSQKIREAKTYNEWLRELEEMRKQQSTVEETEKAIQEKKKQCKVVEEAKKVFLQEEKYLQKAEEKKQAIQRREHFAHLQKEIKEKLETASLKKREAQKEYEQNYPLLGQNVKKLEEEIEAAKNLAEVEKELLALEEKWKQYGQQEKEEKKEQEVVKKHQETCQKWLQEKENLEVALEKAKGELEECQQTYTMFCQCENERKQCEKEQEQIQEQEKILLQYMQEWQEKRACYEEKNREYIASQSYFLARELKAGKACPVCGSTSHPHPANDCQTPVTKEQVETARKEEEKVQGRKENCQLRLEKDRTKWENHKRSILEKVGDFTGETVLWEEIEGGLSYLIREREKALKDCTAYYKKLEQDGTKKKQLQKEVEQGKEKLAQLDQAREKRKEEMYRLELERQSKRTKKEILQEKVTISSQKEGEEKIGELKKKMEEMLCLTKNRERTWEKTQEEYNTLLGNQEENRQRIQKVEQEETQTYEHFIDALKKAKFSQMSEYRETLEKQKDLLGWQEEIQRKEKQILEYKTRFQVLQEKIGDKKETDITPMEEKLGEMEEQYQSQKETYDHAHYQYENNKKVCTRVKDLATAREDMMKRLQVIKSLNDTANGKVHFQTYVQRQYFKKIIQAANIRLSKMTGNSFLLKCREITENGKGEVGLDLDVYNPVNGKVRDAHTLSGGETFLASLSMALGMADVVQNTVGKTHLDTMFIDEGFGSLSEEVRNTAVRVLLDLAGKNRLVGVISHVTELKEQIPNKLFVTKGTQGSTVAWNREE